MVTKAEFLFMIQSVNLPPSAHTITFSAHCSSHYIFSAHTAAAITSSVHTLQQPLHLQCTHCSSHYISSAHFSHVQLPAANLQCTLQLFYPVHTAANCSHLQPPTLQLFYLVYTAAILSSAHCSYTIQCTLQLFYPVHTAAILSSAHCSYTIQCTLQLYYPVHTAATLSIQYIQCTFEPPQGKPVPLLAYLQSSQQTLMVDCSSP